MPIIVGTPECTIASIVNLLKQHPTFSQLRDGQKWIDVAKNLNTNREKQLTLKTESCTSELLHQLLEEWVGRTSENADLLELIRVFEINGLKSLADALRRKFGVDAPDSFPGIVNHSFASSSTQSFRETGSQQNVDLYSAITSENIQLVQEIVASSDRDVINALTDGETPLITAARVSDKSAALTMIKCIIDSGKVDDVSAKGDGGFTFLHALLEPGTTLTPEQFHDITVYLVEREEKYLFTARSDATRFDVTPLHLAVGYGKVDERTLRLLHSKGVRFNAKANRVSVLKYAKKGKQSENVMRYLKSTKEPKNTCNII